MSLITRNGNRYYYRAKRVNGRVVRIYCGANEIADQLAKQDQARAAQAAADKAKELAEIAEYDTLAALVDEQIKMANLLVKATLLVSGYHQHKGQWRKIRAKKPPKSPKPKRPNGNQAR